MLICTELIEETGRLPSLIFGNPNFVIQAKSSITTKLHESIRNQVRIDILVKSAETLLVITLITRHEF